MGLAKDNFGRPVNVGDKVRIIGSKPHNPVVDYTDMMYDILNAKSDRTYIVDFTAEIDDNMFVIHAADWNWDPRNIQKVVDIKDFKYPEPESFNPSFLDC